MLQSLRIRTMRDADLNAVLAVQGECYTTLPPESYDCYLAKLTAAPDSCFVAMIDQTIVGYLLAFPWLSTQLPAYNANQCELPNTPDCFYLHDLAVSPVARRAGVGKQLVQLFFEVGEAAQLPLACLIAVAGAHSFWRRHGFEIVKETPAIATKLRAYGSQAFYMQRRLGRGAGKTAI